MNNVRGIALFLSSFLFAISLGVSFSHWLQRAPKATLSAETFLQIHQVLISRYGVVMGIVEIGAVLALVMALIGIKGNALLTSLVGMALASILAMLLVWAVGLNPINQTVNAWTPQTLPQDWAQVRERWAALHFVRLLLAALGLSSLLLSFIVTKST